MKKTKIVIVVILFVTLAPFVAEADGYVGGGSELTVSPDFTPQSVPNLFVEGGFDFFFPVGENWSFFLTGAGEFSWFPITGDFGGKAYLSGDATYRSQSFFSRLTVSSSFDHTSWQKAPYWYQFSELYLSLDSSRVSYYVAPVIVWEIDENIHIPGIEGTFGLAADIQTIVLNPEIEGGIHFLPEMERRTFYGSLIELSWYPGVPFTLSSSLGFTRNDSTETETLVQGEEPLPVNTYINLFFRPKISFLITQKLDLSFSPPLDFMIMDHGAIVEETLQSTPEYKLYFGPQIEINLQVSKIFSLTLDSGCEFIWSNSPSEEGFSWTTTLSGRFSF